MSAPALPRDRLDPGLVRLALVLALGGFAAMLDTTVVAVAIPRLSSEFHAVPATVQWVGTGYVLALTAVVPLGARLTARFGTRRLWLASLALFLAGSMLCGAAWSIGSLVAFRVVQGAAGGLLLPLGRLILADAGGKERLGRVMAFVMIPGQLAPILGPVLGGLVLARVDWRWTFFVNAPVCLLAIAFAARTVPDSGRGPLGRLDVRGLLLLMPGLAALVYGLSSVGERGGFTTPASAVPLAAGVLLLAGYVWHALSASATPVVDLRLFRDRGFASSSALLFLFGVSLFGAMFLLPLFHQQLRGEGPLEAGLLLAPQGLGAAAALYLVGRLVDRTGRGREIALAGMALAALATVPYALAGPGTSEVLLGFFLLLRGFGLAASILPAMTATYATLPASAVGPATTANRIVQQVGQAAGIATVAVVLQWTGGGAHGFAVTFWLTIGSTVLAGLAALMLPRSR